MAYRVIEAADMVGMTAVDGDADARVVRKSGIILCEAEGECVS